MSVGVSALFLLFLSDDLDRVRTNPTLENVFFHEKHPSYESGFNVRHWLFSGFFSDL